MSPRVALFCLAALLAASIALRVSQAIDRAVSLLCPCDGHTT